ncbi:hypothetical protein PVAP13_8NG155201 [Panicum virgatum]|uniref:Disease resistance R13L4/SHOC-2-like LRR domain-containing protein n=1 Tax=Panicum virgatum TaxID=38727 RepID=A0A8T0PEE9_PANVG|nr:hypothetical protein PVAP13_8NG155201 [Panicum virgatum]
MSSQAEEMTKIIKNGAHNRSISIFGNNSELVKHDTQILNSQVLRVLNIRSWLVKECYLQNVKRISQMKYGHGVPQLPEDTEKLQHLETLNIRRYSITKLPAGIIQLQILVRLNVPSWVQLPDGIGNLQALEELSYIGLGYQSVKCIQGLGDRTNLKVLGILWRYSREVGDVEGKHVYPRSPSSSQRLQQLYVGEFDDTLSFIVIMCRYSTTT